VQQTDVTASKNTPGTIATAQTLEGVMAQVQQNNQDLPAAIKANSEATLDQQGVFAVDALLSSTPAAAAAKATGTATGTATGKGKKNGKNNQKRYKMFVS
jgi:hypothetical protein